MWEPAKEAPHPSGPALADGIAADIGLYDDLPSCLSVGEWAETGVVEHRYGTIRPEQYEWMVKRWGHTAQGPRRYSVTSFIGSTLGTLSRVINVTYKRGRGTGFFSYNADIGMWTLKPVPADAREVTWAAFAAELGHDPGDWPLLAYNAGT
jgi:hypothetical protein